MAIIIKLSFFSDQFAAGGGGGSRPVVIENIVILDGQVIDKRIRKVALDGIGLQV